MPRLSRDTLALLALGYTQIVLWGAVYYAISVLAKPMAAELGWSPTFIFAGFSLSLLVGGLTAKPAARFIDHHGGRRAMTLGATLSAAGLGLLGIVHHGVVYLAAFSLLGLASRLSLYDAAFATLVEMHGHKARRAISVLTLFGGLASTAFWPLAHWLDAALGWRMTWLAFAALVLVTCVPLHWLALRDKAHHAEAAAQAEPDPPPLLVGSARQTAILLLAIALGANSFVFTALSAHMIALFTAFGLAVDVAVGISSIKGMAQTGGRFAEMTIGQRLPPLWLAVAAVGFLPLAFAAFALFGATAQGAIAFAVLYGLSNGLVTIVRGALPLTLFGRQGYAQVLATIAAPGLVVTAAAPMAFAALIDVAGGVAGLSLLFMLSLASLFSIGLLTIKAGAVTRRH